MRQSRTLTGVVELGVERWTLCSPVTRAEIDWSRPGGGVSDTSVCISIGASNKRLWNFGAVAERMDGGGCVRSSADGAEGDAMMDGDEDSDGVSRMRGDA